MQLIKKNGRILGSGTLMKTIDFNKHDVNIFINGTWQKYAGKFNIGHRVTLQNYKAF